MLSLLGQRKVVVIIGIKKKDLRLRDYPVKFVNCFYQIILSDFDILKFRFVYIKNISWQRSIFWHMLQK